MTVSPGSPGPLRPLDALTKIGGEYEVLGKNKEEIIAQHGE